MLFSVVGTVHASDLSSSILSRINTASGGDYNRCFTFAQQNDVQDAQHQCFTSALRVIINGFDSTEQSLYAFCVSRNNATSNTQIANCALDSIGFLVPTLTPEQANFYFFCFTQGSSGVSDPAGVETASHGCMVNTLTRTDFTIPSSSTPVDLGGTGDSTGTDIGGGGPGTDIGGTGSSGGSDSQVSFEVKNPLRFKSIEELITAVIKLLIQIGLSIAVLFIVYAGFLYVTAAGNSEKVTKAHQVFLWAVIGTAILLGALVIMSVIQSTISQVTGT